MQRSFLALATAGEDRAPNRTISMPMPAASPMDYVAVPLVGMAAVVVVGGSLGLVRTISRYLNGLTGNAAQATTYECGEVSEGEAWFRFNNRFAIVALLFLVFDVELALLLPVLPRFQAWVMAGEGWLVFAKVAAFVLTLALALVYSAVRGDFAWVRESRTLSRRRRS
jgi:NADH-quinone oxidoreductase subunit A